MKKIVLKFGLISGAFLAAWIVAMVPLWGKGDHQNGEIIGYTAMFLAFLLVFFGIRSYRDTVSGGMVTFGRAFKVGILITLITCGMYVGTWEVVYFNFLPDFGEKYAASVVAKMRKDGASEAAIAKSTADMARFTELYKNPMINVGMTFMEVFPVGLIMTLISAAILRRTTPPLPAAATAIA